MSCIGRLRKLYVDRGHAGVFHGTDCCSAVDAERSLGNLKLFRLRRYCSCNSFVPRQKVLYSTPKVGVASSLTRASRCCHERERRGRAARCDLSRIPPLLYASAYSVASKRLLFSHHSVTRVIRIPLCQCRQMTTHSLMQRDEGHAGCWCAHSRLYSSPERNCSCSLGPSLLLPPR